MANKWGIPKEVEDQVIKRDTSCVYCGIAFKEVDLSRRTKPSWEHIVNDIRIKGTDNIALCCISCNSSKGSKHLEDWLKSNYCEHNRISLSSVPEVVRKAYYNPPKP